MTVLATGRVLRWLSKSYSYFVNTQRIFLTLTCVCRGNSTAYEAINRKPVIEKSFNEKFNDLPQAAKIAIYAGGAAVAAAMLAGLIFYCIKQRRRGATEARLADERTHNDRLELEGMKKAGINPDAFSEHGHEYNPREINKGGATYTAVDDPDPFQEKPWGAAVAGAGAGAAGARVLSRSSTYGSNASYHDVPMSPRTPQSGTFPSTAAGAGFNQADSPGRVGSPMSRVGSPQSRIGSPGPSQGYGAHRMQQQREQGTGERSFSESNNQAPYGASRANNGPSPISPAPRSFSEGPGAHGYRQ